MGCLLAGDYMHLSNIESQFSVSQTQVFCSSGRGGFAICCFNCKTGARETCHGRRELSQYSSGLIAESCWNAVVDRVYLHKWMQSPLLILSWPDEA